VTAVVAVNLPDAPASITDLLTGESMELRGGSFAADIQPSGFRILAVRLR